nr:MAG TPA: hypothetical protein [Caudoviricetes sp.]
MTRRVFNYGGGMHCDRSVAIFLSLSWRARKGI